MNFYVMNMLAKNLLWVDIETTGLEPKSSVILELSIIVTNSKLEILDSIDSLVINHPEDILNQKKMNDWCFSIHSNNFLLKESRDSTLSLAEAEKQIIKFFNNWSLPNCSPLCGNSVHFDRIFLKYYLPRVEGFFSYRNLDVSSFKEFISRAYDFNYEKNSNHRAHDDLVNSINEMRYYAQHFLLPQVSDD